MDSILTSVKKLLGLPADYEAFDPDIIMHINTVLMILSQMGGFDVPQSSVTKEALQNTASEMEWRLNVEHDHPEE